MIESGQGQFIDRGQVLVNSEQLLIERSKKKDLEAFEELVSLYEHKIYNFAYRMMGNVEDAQDMTQEAFFRAFKYLEGFRGEASFSTWLYRITANLCKDELRKRYRLPVDSLDEKISLHDGEVHKQIPSSQPGPEAIYTKRELRQDLGELLGTLSPEFRLAVVLRDVLGFSYREISELMECSLGTVKSRISRGRGYLRERLLTQQEQNASFSGRNKVKGGEKNEM